MSIDKSSTRLQVSRHVAVMTATGCRWGYLPPRAAGEFNHRIVSRRVLPCQGGLPLYHVLQAAALDPCPPLTPGYHEPAVR